MLEEIRSILTNFLSSLNSEILDYFNLCHSYLRNLISYKNIDLSKKTSQDSKKTIRNSLKEIKKAIKTGLNTIGISIEKISNEQKKLDENVKEFLDYNAFFEMNLISYVNRILFGILIEYIIDLDTKKIKTLNLFNLLTQDFIIKLDQFKKKNITTSDLKEKFQTDEIYKAIDFKNLFLKPGKREDDQGDLNILKQLQIAKQNSIETLKIPKKEIINEESIPKPDLDQPKASLSIELMDKEPHPTFLDFFGNFHSIHPEIISRFKINVMNFLNSRVVNPDFLDLENLFYYISILRMLNIEFPFAPIEILELVNNYINGNMFCASRGAKPDPANIFFGLAIFSELNLLNTTDKIDLLAIEMFLESELKEFIPEKLSLNYFTLFSLRLLEKSGTIIMNKQNFLNSIFNLRPYNLKEYKPVTDIYHHLSLIKLINKRVNLQPFKSIYAESIKNLLKPNGSVNDIITDSAKVLLIFDLLELKEQESAICNKLLKFILNSTSFFNLEDINRDFNWRTDKLGYKVELRMLFWSILASSLYAPLIT